MAVRMAVGLAILAGATLIACSEDVQGVIGAVAGDGGSPGGGENDAGGFHGGVDGGGVGPGGDGGASDGGEARCTSGTMRPCWTGPKEARGKGICRDGKQACVGGTWQPCTGQVLPEPREICGNKVDDTCDGNIDEGCACRDGDTQDCYTGPKGTKDVGLCRGGKQHCEKGYWGACADEVVPVKESCAGVPDGFPPPDSDCDGKADAAVANACGTCGPTPKEICGNGIDDNCDGNIDEGCACPDGASRACYTGPKGTEGVGACRAGTQKCVNGAWDTCKGDVTPKPEICGNHLDDNCNGIVDDGCPCADGERQRCYTGPAGTEGVGTCRAGFIVCNGGGWSDCQGEVKPASESCAGVPNGALPPDSDCDGKHDPKVLNKCGFCGPNPPEICGNGIDDDCDGVVDNGCDCNADCDCSGGTCTCRPRFDQPCYSGPLTAVGKGICVSGLHDCTLQNGKWQWTPCVGDVLPLPAEICGNGLDDNCNGVADEGCNPDQCNPETGEGCVVEKDCEDWQDRPCYTGPAATRGVGACRDGVERCVGNKWSGVCEGEVKPQGEVCGDKIDNDCDGTVDNGCACGPGDTRECWTGPLDAVFKKDNPKSICVKGAQTCGPDGAFGACSGQTLPAVEICGDKLDNDCNGFADEFCDCMPGQTRPCYTGPAATRGVGICKDGVETCGMEGWSGACVGQVLPAAEVCGDKIDNDCNGLIDDNVNACGKCDDPCYQEDYPDPGDCNAPGRKCNGTEPDTNNPGAITLGQVQASAPFIYISVTQRNQVAKLDTVTGAKMWQVDSHGVNPSRTAVALDYSVWVGNRGFSNPSDPAISNLVHLDLDGNFLCRGDVVNIARSVAIDAYGNVWAGEYNTGRIHKFDGSIIDATQNPPRCKELLTVETGVNIYGLAIDGRGYLYTSSSPNTAKVNTGTGLVEIKPANPSFYGVAVDKGNNVWFGGWSGGSVVHRMLGDPPYTIWNTAVNNVTAVTVHPDDGTIWGSSYGTDEVVKIDPNTGQALCRHAVSNGTNPHGVAVDGAGKVWTPLRYGGYANRWTKDCQPDGSFPVDPGQELYTYSDMTGVQLRTITTKEGHWIQDFDSGYPSPKWYKAEWTATFNPPDTGVDVSFKAADTAGGLQSNPTPTCGPFTASPADLTTCPLLAGHRWLEADVRLWTKKDGVRPTLRDLKLYWARP